MTSAFAVGQITGPLLLAWSERSLGVGASLALAAFALLASAWALWRIPRNNADAAASSNDNPP
jgi:hypothetical protein